LLAGNARRARCAVEVGQYRKAVQSLTSIAGLLQPLLGLAKHPQDDPPALPDDPVPATVTISEAEVMKDIRSFPNGTSPGPLVSGLAISRRLSALLLQKGKSRCVDPAFAHQALCC
jgi:hypothetical protein